MHSSLLYFVVFLLFASLVDSFRWTYLGGPKTANLPATFAHPGGKDTQICLNLDPNTFFEGLGYGQDVNDQVGW